jgi:RNA polymerase sigma factor (TIGR02999 family)
MAEVTQRLIEWGAGDQRALEQLMPVIYRELHQMARRYMAGEKPGHTLQASALVNEAYLKLIDVTRVDWQNRAHFFGVSAQLMRRILVDFARRKHFQKRGGGAQQVTFHEEMIAGGLSSDVIAVDEALKALEAIDSRKVRVVEMRFFAGLSTEETAEALKISTDTVTRDWKFAKAWLQRELKRGTPQMTPERWRQSKTYDRLSDQLSGHEVRTALEMAWDTLKNGALLTQAEKSGFSVLITSDKGIKEQQSMKGRLIAVVIIRAPNNRLETHLTMISEIAQVVAVLQPGQVIEVFHSEMKP